MSREHKKGAIAYDTSPPVGGAHSPLWQNCSGDVYANQIPNENAVHSLEHGAVWVTYRPDVQADQVEQLEARVRGHDYTLMSPYPGLTAPIAIQAWGSQLTTNSAADPAIDSFIIANRVSAGADPGGPCYGGNVTTGSVPVDTAA